MKEKKFRAWDKDNKQMLKDEDIDTENCGGFWMLRDHSNYILMQYTGLKDKNGKEIYEEDILGNSGANTPTPRFVIFYPEWGCYMLSTFKGSLYPLRKNEFFMDEEEDIEFADRLEILGNTYENPELLENV